MQCAEEGRLVELFLEIQMSLQQKGRAEDCASPGAAQPFSPTPMEQSNDCSVLRDTAASSAGDRGHLKGNTDVFAPQSLRMEGLDELLEDNLITE